MPCILKKAMFSNILVFWWSLSVRYGFIVLYIYKLDWSCSVLYLTYILDAKHFGLLCCCCKMLYKYTLID